MIQSFSIMLRSNPFYAVLVVREYKNTTHWLGHILVLKVFGFSSLSQVPFSSQKPYLWTGAGNSNLPSTEAF